MEKVTVFAESFYLPERMAEAEKLIEHLIAETRKEKGCITYNLYRDKNDSNHTMFFEEWESQAALDAHGQSPHFTSIVPKLGEMRTKPGTFLASETKQS